jgi:peroxiredoxin (alkyl hydroperoxide reductase subunit C)
VPRTYALEIGDDAPDFTAQTTAGPLRLHDYIDGSWALFTTHPTVYTGVCSTELVAEARQIEQIRRRGFRALTLAEGSTEDHRAWAEQLGSQAGVPIDFPIITDPELAVARAYGFDIPKNDRGHALSRSVVVIDPSKTVRWFVTYPPRTGRNFAEIIRVLDSLLISDEYGLATPADWEPGEPLIVPPNRSTEEVEQRFGAVDSSSVPYIRRVDVSRGAAPSAEQETRS